MRDERLARVRASSAAGWGGAGKVKLGELAPIAWSELLRDLESLRA
ncbi:MAG: hypothetical protein IPF92_03880 [Myxococcales bacterium]|nr:hypothetical protein [Myxococcales bacterium]MBL0196598.1 hypothetical protein [Myxococcales bacterium]HQY65371.1 hypothetical protein [Polyangiaceae bacterium]